MSDADSRSGKYYFIAGFRVIIYVPTAFFQVLRHPQEAQ